MLASDTMVLLRKGEVDIAEMSIALEETHAAEGSEAHGLFKITARLAVLSTSREKASGNVVDPGRLAQPIYRKTPS